MIWVFPKFINSVAEYIGIELVVHICRRRYSTILSMVNHVVAFNKTCS